MPDELECKLYVHDHNILRERLRAAGATFLGSALETNRLFDNDAGSLLATGCGLRIRTFAVDADGSSRTPLLTFKGPQRESRFKHRPEIEVRVNDPDAMIAILRSLGYSERIVFEKRRESWTLRGAAIELDELPLLGRFIEVEAANEASIATVIELLGLDPSDSIRKSYVAMLIERAPTGTAPPRAFRFSESSPGA